MTAEAEPLKPLLSEPRAAEVCGVNPKTLARRRWSGDGPVFVQIGSRILYRPDDLEAWLQSRRRHSTAEKVG